MAKIIGIDLGTSNSAAAVIMGGKPTIIPAAEGAGRGFKYGGEDFESDVAVLIGLEVFGFVVVVADFRDFKGGVGRVLLVHVHCMDVRCDIQAVLLTDYGGRSDGGCGGVVMKIAFKDRVVGDLDDILERGGVAGVGLRLQTEIPDPSRGGVIAGHAGLEKSAGVGPEKFTGTPRLSIEDADSFDFGVSPHNYAGHCLGFVSHLDFSLFGIVRVEALLCTRLVGGLQL